MCGVGETGGLVFFFKEIQSEKKSDPLIEFFVQFIISSLN